MTAARAQSRRPALSNQINKRSDSPSVVSEPTVAQQLEQVLLTGDLAQLTPDQRLLYYNQVCESTGLNPLTKPFDYIRLNNKLTLYARKDATDQLRRLHHVSIYQVDKHLDDDGTYTVTAYARDREGREDVEDGVVSLTGLKGEALANARMKALTKAKRRVTLSIAGLGWLDESEVDSIPGAQRVEGETGSAAAGSKSVSAAADRPQLLAAGGRDRRPIVEKYRAYLAKCSTLKRQLGAARYYQVLKNFDLGHANDVAAQDLATMKQVVQALQQGLRVEEIADEKTT